MLVQDNATKPWSVVGDWRSWNGAEWVVEARVVCDAVPSE
jgi:hypothetical protein